MDINKMIERIDRYEATVGAYYHAMGVLGYDAATVAPEKSVTRRGQTLEVLSGVVFDMSTDPELILTLNSLWENRDQLSSETVRRVELLKKSSDKISKIPKDEYIAYESLVNTAQEVWHRAKPANDFEMFAPCLEKLVESSIRIYGYTDPDKDPYNAALDEYEKGLDSAKLDEFFGKLRSELVPLIKKISASTPPREDFLFGDYPVELQRKFSDRLMSALAIDRSRCIIGETLHPFTENFGRDDVRITTNYDPQSLASSMYSVIHEGGHALYELGSGEDLEGTVLAGGAAMSIHESQSRLYENMIGRSREFCEYILPQAKEIFPERLKGIDGETFWKGVNLSRPSLIRTEADELTYSFHVMVRYDIERLLFSGRVNVSELPRIWAEKMWDYLGVEVPDDRQGVLQDSHWSGGAFGYFPSYALGSAYAAQIYATAQKEIDIPSLVASGNISRINQWLEERLWRFGRMYDPWQLLEKCCGSEFDPSFYTDDLKNKFSKIYSL